MQHQLPQQEQCGNQQMVQPVMLCPVQYVYESTQLLPQPQENQMQQNQILINVKNPPPWIQNRTQNQVVYVQQMPNNYQHYMHPQMIQNHIYHPQMSYQMQPMLSQDNRQFIHIPNLHQYNTAQNPIAHINNEETEKMPLLTQMLNQKANVNSNRGQNTNNVSTPAVNIIRPITQNQQVQTDNISPSVKGRPRNVSPQIITINPMQQRQITHQKQEVSMNVRPTNIRNELPQHIRTKIPSSISVKTINRPILPRTIVRPLDAMTAQQNFYYNPIIMPSPNINAKNIITNSEMQYMKRNNFQQEIQSTATVPMQYSIPVSNVSPFSKVAIVQNLGDVNTNKQTVNVNGPVKCNVNSNKTYDDINKKPQTNIVSNTHTEVQTQTEEKLIRNTVFIQARGRVLNDKESIQNQYLKRTIDDRLKEESNRIQETSNEAKTTEEAIQISKKIKTEVTDNNRSSGSETNQISTEFSTTNVSTNIPTQQSRINNLQVKFDNLQKDISDESEKNKAIFTNNVHLSSLCKSDKTKSVTEDRHSEQNNLSKACMDTKKKNLEDPEASDKENKQSDITDETKPDNIEKKEGNITVLTHVLEGYIIQESNVAFPIQKPTMEKDTFNNQIQNKLTKTVNKEDNNYVKLENERNSSRRYLNRNIESEKEMEFAVIDKDDPFANVKKSTVESWTAEQLASHLEKHSWTETASKLLDEEIDGESMLLVNRDQLVAIGVCEEHAEAIVAYATR